MNELDPKHSATFQLIQENGIYLFTFNNLVRIILEAITHQSEMFVEPLPIKNPYTNTIFSKTELFNIYFAMRLRNIRIHELVEKFFRCEFNIYEFRRIHETELRDIAIEQHAKTASYSDLLQDIDDMLRNHNMTKRIKICSGFPLSKLVDTMRPLLKLHLLEHYSFSSMTRKYAKARLHLDLNRFAEQNPLYGRKLAVGYRIPPNENPFSPQTEYIQSEPSYVINTNPYRKRYCYIKYMETHIYKDDIFDRYVDVGDTIDAYVDPLLSLIYPTARNYNQEVDEETFGYVSEDSEEEEQEPDDSIFEDNQSEQTQEGVVIDDTETESEYEEDADSIS